MADRKPAWRESDFTDSERQHLKDTAKEREHRAWLFSMVKRWGTWVIALILGVGPVWDAIGKAVVFFRDHTK